MHFQWFTSRYWLATVNVQGFVTPAASYLAPPFNRVNTTLSGLFPEQLLLSSHSLMAVIAIFFLFLMVVRFTVLPTLDQTVSIISSSTLISAKIPFSNSGSLPGGRILMLTVCSVSS